MKKGALGNSNMGYRIGKEVKEKTQKYLKQKVHKKVLIP